MAQHNGAAPSSSSLSLGSSYRREGGKEGRARRRRPLSCSRKGRDDGGIYVGLHWLHRAPHYPPINSQTPPCFLDSSSAAEQLRAPLYPRPYGEKEGRGVQNKSCLKSGKSLDGISDPAASSARRPSVRLSVDPFQTVAHTHHDDPSCGRPRPPARARQTGRPRADRNLGILMGLQRLEL